MLQIVEPEDFVKVNKIHKYSTINEQVEEYLKDLCINNQDTQTDQYNLNFKDEMVNSIAIKERNLKMDLEHGFQDLNMIHRTDIKRIFHKDLLTNRRVSPKNLIKHNNQ